MAEHTPVPWSEPYQDDYPGDEGWWILNGKSGIDEYAVCVTFWMNPNQEADARFIWRACNAHDDLLAALERVEEINRRDETWNPDLTATDNERREAWQEVAEAIAKGRGQA